MYISCDSVKKNLYRFMIHSCVLTFKDERLCVVSPGVEPHWGEGVAQQRYAVISVAAEVQNQH